MHIEGEYTFQAPRDVVYRMLQDPDALARAMPGATTLTRVDEDTYEAEVGVKVGAISGSYAGTVAVRDKVPNEHFRLLVEGKGAAGFLRGEGTVELEDAEGGTLIRYAGDTQVGGRIAQVGQRLVQSVARRMIGQGLQSLEEQLQAHQVEEGGASES